MSPTFILTNGTDVIKLIMMLLLLRFKVLAENPFHVLQYYFLFNRLLFENIILDMYKRLEYVLVHLYMCFGDL